MKLTNDQRVGYEAAKVRVLKAFGRLGVDELQAPSQIADFIWPNHQMRKQGAAGAASRILKKMQEEGIVRWSVEETHEYQRWGWMLTKSRETALRLATGK